MSARGAPPWPALLAVIPLAAWSAVAAVPAPAGYFGHEIGADRTVLDWDKVVAYFQLLAKSSDRIRVDELGRSTEDRPHFRAILKDTVLILVPSLNPDGVDSAATPCLPNTPAGWDRGQRGAAAVCRRGRHPRVPECRHRIRHTAPRRGYPDSGVLASGPPALKDFRFFAEQ